MGTGSRRPTVLIVEDHESTRKALAGLFRRKAWEVIAVGTVAEGMDRLNPPPDSAIVDLMLPDGGGERVVEAIMERGLATHVAVCSGTGDEERLKAVERIGPVTVLRKPIDPGDLFRAVATASGDISG